MPIVCEHTLIGTSDFTSVSVNKLSYNPTSNPPSIESGLTTEEIYVSKKFLNVYFNHCERPQSLDFR